MSIKDLNYITSRFGAMYCENEEGEFELYDVFAGCRRAEIWRFYC